MPRPGFAAAALLTAAFHTIAWAQETPAAAPNAPAASEYSEIAPLASKSLLLDLVWAGPRIVVVGERGHVLLSDDRGTTWRQAKVPTLANLTGVFFVDARNGWAVGHDETILRSTDGGETWSTVHSAPDKQQPLLAVWFKDANRGFAIGAYGTILATTDGGYTWHDHTFDPRPVGARSKPAPKAEDEFAEEQSPGDSHLNAIAASAGGRLYIAAERGNIFRSDDDGASWLVLPTPYEGSFFGVLPLDGDSLLAYGLRGHLFSSTDAGMTWREIRTDTVAMLTDAVRVASNTIAVSGLAGTLLVSAGGDGAFSLKQFPDRRGMSAILALDQTHFVVAGEGGVRTVTP